MNCNEIGFKPTNIIPSFQYNLSDMNHVHTKGALAYCCLEGILAVQLRERNLIYNDTFLYVKAAEQSKVLG